VAATAARYLPAVAELTKTLPIEDTRSKTPQNPYQVIVENGFFQVKPKMMWEYWMRKTERTNGVLPISSWVEENAQTVD
jgi:hypothetical protein